MPTNISGNRTQPFVIDDGNFGDGVFNLPSRSSVAATGFPEIAISNTASTPIDLTIAGSVSATQGAAIRVTSG
ncbi:MAG: hypothetical protein AB3N13_08660, partial [Arenibacterium sp.]